MIELITGTPGSGKTLYAISQIKAKSEKENRPVYYSGIADLTLGWTEIDPEKWFDAPPNSIVVIDECQKVFRPRSFGGQVPQYVSELETHRHKGIDLVFITQHPMLVDSNIRRLVGRHFHVARRFGTHRASIFEYESCKDQPLNKIESATARHEWAYPKVAFNYYKSAEVHNFKRRIPTKYYIILASIAVIIGASWIFLNRFSDKINGTDHQKATPGLVSQNTSTGSVTRNSKTEVSPYQYYIDRAPRIVGLQHTAPAYDEVVKPIRAAIPVACISDGSRCLCSSQQGTRMDVPKAMCMNIVEKGYFVDWQERTESASKRVEKQEVSTAVTHNPA